MVDIADIAFTNVDPEEKKLYEGTMLQTGSYQGYKLRNYWHIDNGVRDQIEHYNCKNITFFGSIWFLPVNHNVFLREHPQSLRPFLPEIDQFARHNHFNVLHPILR